MKILKNEGTFKILTPKKELEQSLLKIETAGRVCYQSGNKPVTMETAQKFVRMLLRSGHESVIEHSSLTVQFINVSRGFTHELVRHRLTSPSQESTRYVDYAKEDKVDLDRFQLKFIVPPHKDEKENVKLENGQLLSLEDMFTNIEMYYRGLRKAGFLAEDARQILPIATKSEIVVTANFREWRHVFSMRTQKAAHWEIRSTMVKLLQELQVLIPVIFDDFAPSGNDKNGLPFYSHPSS